MPSSNVVVLQPRMACACPVRYITQVQFRLQAAMHEVFEDDDMRQIFRWLHKFLNNPYSEDDQLVPAGKLWPK